MFCPECGRQNPDTAKFCIDCGYNYNQPLNGAFPISPSKTSLPYQNIPAKNLEDKNSSAPAIILLLIIISGIAIFAFYNVNVALNLASPNERNTSNSYTEGYYSNSSYASQDLSLQAQSQRIVNDAFTLSAGEITQYKFTIPNKSGNARIVGNFNASGGSDNAIFVLITNETGLQNLKNGNNPKAYYSSGKVMMDDISVTLSPGTYYIVFSNAHSLLTPKAVTASINLEY